MSRKCIVFVNASSFISSQSAGICSVQAQKLCPGNALCCHHHVIQVIDFSQSAPVAVYSEQTNFLTLTEEQELQLRFRIIVVKAVTDVQTLQILVFEGLILVGGKCSLSRDRQTKQILQRTLGCSHFPLPHH